MQNDTYLGELNQIREKQLGVIAEIDEIKERYANQIPADLEKIQGDALMIVIEIDEIKKRREDELQAGFASSGQPHRPTNRTSEQGSPLFF